MEMLQLLEITLLVSFGSLDWVSDCMFSAAFRIARSERSIFWLCIEGGGRGTVAHMSCNGRERLRSLKGNNA